jgi:hypothetical protein
VASSLASIAPSSAVPAPQTDGRERAPGIAGRPSEAAEAAHQDRVTISDEARARTDELTSEELQHLDELEARDAHVRTHEAAHQAAGGALAGGASFTYELGPDGRSYAVGGEVPVRLQRGGTPDETIANARQVRRAALAPADPSAQDLSVAAQAMSMEQAALAEKARQAVRAYSGQSGTPSVESVRALPEASAGRGSSMGVSAA